MRVAIANRHPRLRLRAREVRALFSTLERSRAALEEPVSVLPPAADNAASELSAVFLTDAALAELHGRFLDDPSVTDVITFPGRAESAGAGEICVSADAARRVGGARDFSAELTLYLVHGWLHLAGHDDLQPERRRRMRRAEQRALTLLRAAGAMPRFTWAARRR